MEYHTQDQNTFRLIPLIRSALKPKTSRRCQESEKLNETVQFGETNEILILFKRYFCSASKIPDSLMELVIEKCSESPEYAEDLSDHVSCPVDIFKPINDLHSGIQ